MPALRPFLRCPQLSCIASLAAASLLLSLSTPPPRHCTEKPLRYTRRFPAQLSSPTSPNSHAFLPPPIPTGSTRITRSLAFFEPHLRSCPSVKLPSTTHIVKSKSYLQRSRPSAKLSSTNSRTTCKTHLHRTAHIPKSSFTMSSSSLFSSLGAALQNFSSPRFSFRTSSPTAKSNPGLNAFESELASQLEQLKSTDEAGYLSIPWLCQAMEVVLSTHASVEAFVPDLQQALADGDTKWLDEYLDDSVKLLDICHALREAIIEIKNYNVHVQLALHTLEKGNMGEAQLRRAKNALNKCVEALKRKDDDVNHLGQRRSKLENCSSMLRRMGEKLNMEDAAKGNFFMVIYAAQVSTIFICGVLTSALSFKPRRPLSSISVGGQSAWSFSLSSLQQRVKEQIEKKKSKGANALLEELDKSDIAVHSLQDRLEKLLNAKSFPLREDQVLEIKEAVASLRVCSVELQHGLAPLEVHVGEVFKVLITSRVALLDIYSHV